MQPSTDLFASWPQLDRLLDEALDQPAAEREAWLLALPREHAGLGSTLRRLLQAHRQAETRDFLNALPALPAPMDAGPQEDAGHLVAQDLVGPYRLLRELGSGGMGRVWLAERADGQLKRQVALKLPHLSWAPGLAERMARERDILATLDHPHIARLYDAGVGTGGRPWLALEFVQGRQIDAYVRDEACSVPARLRLLLQVCSAVAYAHSQLVIHRDLKPSNILVTDDGQVRLLDFGIAKLLQGAGVDAEATAFTQAAGRVMTLDYASPEQIRGVALGTASDVYSLAVVAFELLAGQRPYRLRRGTAAELEEAIAAAEPPRASDMAATPELKKRLRGDLDAILNHALKKDPGSRYPSVAALAADITRHMEGHPVLARPDGRWYRARRFLRRHWLPTAALSAVLGALSVGLGVALWQADQARQSERQSQRAVEREDAVKDLYLETLAQVAAWDAASFAQPGSVPQQLQRLLGDFEKRYADSPERRLGLLESVSVTLPFMGDFSGSLAVGQRYRSLLAETGSEPWRQQRAALGVARALSNLDRHTEAETVLREALARFPTERSRNTVLVQSELGKVLATLGRRAEALRVLEAALVQADGVDHASTRWNVHTAHARLYIGYDEPLALRLLQGALQTYRADPQAFPVEFGPALKWQGMVLLDMGRAVEAEAVLRSSVSLLDTHFGAVDPESVFTLGQLAAALAAQGRHDEATQMLAQRSAAVEQRPGTHTAAARSSLVAQRLANQAAQGDRVAAAASLLQPPPAETPGAALRDLSTWLVGETWALVASGHAEEGVRRAARWLAHPRLAGSPGPEAFQVQLAMAGAMLAGAQPAAALQALDALSVTMQTAGVRDTALFREVMETAALAQARLDTPSDVAAAVARLIALDARGSAHATNRPVQNGTVPDTVRTMTGVQRAESAMRRAEVLLAADRRPAAIDMTTTLLQDLATQHPTSPRLVAAKRLLDKLHQ